MKYTAPATTKHTTPTTSASGPLFLVNDSPLRLIHIAESEINPRLIRTIKSVTLTRKSSPAIASSTMETRMNSQETLATDLGRNPSSPREERWREAAMNAGTKVVNVAIRNATAISTS